ncbi:MAG: DUF6537 domain-containing protein [Acidimicrobiales bacterium]
MIAADLAERDPNAARHPGGSDLIDYRTWRTPRLRGDAVARVRSLESAAVPGDSRLSESVARNLHKLMAYKDEYEVARLHRSEAFQAAIKEQFGDESTITYKLHPPTARKLGLTKKIGLGRSGDIAFAGLARMKGLRGKAIDPFGRSAHRTLERELIDEYRTVIDDLLAGLNQHNVDTAVEIAELPDMIRGYEQIKERNVEAYRAKLAELTSARG